MIQIQMKFQRTLFRKTRMSMKRNSHLLTRSIKESVFSFRQPFAQDRVEKVLKCLLLWKLNRFRRHNVTTYFLLIMHERPVSCAFYFALHCSIEMGKRLKVTTRRFLINFRNNRKLFIIVGGFLNGVTFDLPLKHFIGLKRGCSYSYFDISAIKIACFWSRTKLFDS